MSKKITVLIFVLLLTLPLAKSQDKPKGIKETIENKPNSGKIYALICGVSEYQDKNIPKLDYAHIDAYNFYKYIISGNFGVVDTANIRIFLNENATAKNLISNLDVLKDKVLEGDKVIIFFSGHGDVKSKKRAKTGYLLMYNACYPTYEGEGAIRLDEFSEACMDFSDKKCDVILFIDACHSGSLSGGKDGAQILTDNLKGLKGEKSEIIKFLSSNGNEFSKEGDAYCNGGGAFTCFLIKGMLGEAENNNGKISVYDLSEYIRKNVREATNKEQNPVQYSSNENYIISYPNQKLLSEFLSSSQTDKKNANLIAKKSPKNKGLPSTTLNSLENNVKSLCIKFSEKLNSKILIEPANDCAYDVYQILRQNKNADIIILDLKELLFGAMLDEFNSLTKNYFRNPDVLNKSNSFKAEKILLKIINLIGDKSPFYKSLQARWLFIKAINEQEKSPKESLKLLSESIKIEEDASYNNNQLGKLYIKLGDYEKAKDCLLACIESSPKWSYGYNNLGVVYFKTGKIDSATSCFIDAINLNNNEAAFYSNYGNCFAVKKDYKKAINCYNNALKLNPNFIEAYSNRGSVYYADGNYSQAILDFTKAIQFDPKNGYLYQKRGEAYSKLGKTQEANTDFKKASDLNYDNDLTHLNSGNMFYDSKNFEKAISEYTQAIKLNPKLIEAYINRGNTYLDLTKYDNAISDYSKVIELDSKYAYAYYLRGYVKFYKNDLKGAKQDWETAVKLDPKYEKELRQNINNIK